MAVSSPKRKNVWSLAGGLSAALILGLLLGAGNAANNQAPPVEVQVSPHHVLHKVPNNAIGINASTYDRDLLYSRLPRLLRNIGIRLIRFPGGTQSDRYNWATNTDVITNQKEAVDFNQFMKLVRKTHAQPMITVNYGTGSVIGTKTHQSGAQIAADWVYYANVLHHYIGKSATKCTATELTALIGNRMHTARSAPAVLPSLWETSHKVLTDAAPKRMQTM